MPGIQYELFTSQELFVNTKSNRYSNADWDSINSETNKLSTSIILNLYVIDTLTKSSGEFATQKGKKIFTLFA